MSRAQKEHQQEIRISSRHKKGLKKKIYVGLTVRTKREFQNDSQR